MIDAIIMIRRFQKILFLSVFLFGIFAAAFLAHAAGNLTGYAWADNGIGWISFNCVNAGVCGASNYGVTVAPNGAMSGYAWANPNDGGQNHIGWINFAPSGPYPASSFVPNQSVRMNPGTGEARGWARVVNYDAVGGWDGWIGFGSGGNYESGVTVTGCDWSGYAWGGGVNIGWIRFNGSGYGVSGSGDGCAPSSNNAPVAEAGISKDGIAYSSSISVVRGAPVNLWLSADKDVTGDGLASRDPDGWTNPTYGVSSGGRCEWNTDLNQGTATYEVSIPNPASAASCNFSLGSRTFNDAPGTYSYQALRITDRQNARSNVAAINIVVSANSAPSANAGPAHSLGAGISHTHAGASAADPDGNLASYSWAFASCPSICPALINSSGSLSGGSAAVAGPTYTPNVAGTYALQLTVADTASQVATALLVESVPLPDLVVSNLAPSPDPPTVGSSVTFGGPIANLGPGDAGASTALFSIDGSAFSTAGIPPLANGSSQNITSGSWTATAGSHTVQLCADSGGAVAESNEGNNCQQILLNLAGTAPNWCEIPSDAPEDYECPP